MCPRVSARRHQGLQGTGFALRQSGPGEAPRRRDSGRPPLDDLPAFLQKPRFRPVPVRCRDLRAVAGRALCPGPERWKILLQPARRQPGNRSSVQPRGIRPAQLSVPGSRAERGGRDSGNGHIGSRSTGLAPRRPAGGNPGGGGIGGAGAGQASSEGAARDSDAQVGEDAR